jgi:hypothetical protein
MAKFHTIMIASESVIIAIFIYNNVEWKHPKNKNIRFIKILLYPGPKFLWWIVKYRIITAEIIIEIMMRIVSRFIYFYATV